MEYFWAIYLAVTLGMATALAIHQWIVVPIAAFITEVRVYAEDRIKSKHAGLRPGVE